MSALSVLTTVQSFPIPNVFIYDVSRVNAPKGCIPDPFPLSAVKAVSLVDKPCLKADPAMFPAEYSLSSIRVACPLVKNEGAMKVA